MRGAHAAAPSEGDTSRPLPSVPMLPATRPARAAPASASAAMRDSSECVQGAGICICDRGSAMGALEMQLHMYLQQNDVDSASTEAALTAGPKTQHARAPSHHLARAVAQQGSNAPVMGEGQGSGFSEASATLKRSPWLIMDTAVTHELGRSVKQTSHAGHTRLPPAVQMTPHVASADSWSVPQRASARRAGGVRARCGGAVRLQCRRGSQRQRVWRCRLVPGFCEHGLHHSQSSSHSANLRNSSSPCQRPGNPSMRVSRGCVCARCKCLQCRLVPAQLFRGPWPCMCQDALARSARAQSRSQSG